MQLAEVHTQYMPLGPSLERTMRDICISPLQVGHADSLPLPFFLLAIFDGRFVAMFFISYSTERLSFSTFLKALSSNQEPCKNGYWSQSISHFMVEVARTGFEPVLPA